MRFFYFALLFFIVSSCSYNTSKKSKLIDFVPEKTSVIIKTSNLESLKNSLTNNDFLEKLHKTTSYKNLENKLESLSLLKPESDILICFSEDENDSLQYSIITKLHNLLFNKDSLKNYKEEAFVYKNRTITKSTLNSNIIYSTLIDSTFFASSSKTIIDNVFNKKDPDLEKIYSTTNNDKTASIIIKPNNPYIKSFFVNDSLNLNSFTKYIAVDVDINQDETIINGITKAIDSTKSLINIFKGTIPQENLIQNITPSNSDGFMSFTFDNFKSFETNLAKFNQKDSTLNTTSLFDNIIEVGLIYKDKNKAVVLNSLDVIATNDALLSEQNKIDTYRQIDIYSFSKPDLFSSTFYPLITFTNATKYCVLDNFFVFAENIDMLQNIIANYQNKTTLSERSYFKDIKEQLTDASSLILVVNPSNLKSILKKNGLNANSKLDKYNTSALQFIYDTNFAHVNGIVKKSKTKAKLNSISEQLNIKLENEILNAPQFVTNHITRQKEIVVQDITNNLYLISNTGKILWKKQLQGPVLGTINQIDIYKNGRLQLAFATPNKFNRANNTIISQPKHFRIGSKDYIVFKTKNKLYILNRTGKTRVTPKTSNTYSKEPIFLYQNKFTTTTNGGNLITTNTKGNTAIQNLNLSKNHNIETTSKTLVTLSENKLTIKNKSIELDYGNYSNPKIFYLNDKIYVTITDLQSQKIYLYDSQTKLLPNFPVYGNSTIDLDNIDKDKNLEFITKGETNSILVYQKN